MTRSILVSFDCMTMSLLRRTSWNCSTCSSVSEYFFALMAGLVSSFNISLLFDMTDAFLLSLLSRSSSIMLGRLCPPCVALSFLSSSSSSSSSILSMTSDVPRSYLSWCSTNSRSFFRKLSIWSSFRGSDAIVESMFGFLDVLFLFHNVF
uniref:Uncharacterized protein n=1 Tax=Cacopsylla melanoneura TaxID=428564 RepID=A0A8D8ZDS2_9HEMI